MAARSSAGTGISSSGSAVGVGVSVGSGVAVGVLLGTEVGVGVKVATVVAVAVGVMVGKGVGEGVGVAVGAGADVSADCVAFSVGGFHSRFLAGRSLAIACPKLDSHQEVYLQKLVAMIDDARIRSLDVLVMEVPCCSGLVRLAQQASEQARRSVPVRCRVIGVQGGIVADTTL